MIKSFIWSVVIAIMLWWFALQSPATAEGLAHPLPPDNAVSSIDASIKASIIELGQKATIEITKIRSGVPPGVAIGGHYDGLLRLLQERYIATGQLDEPIEQAARSLLEDELNQAGYSVVQSPLMSVFAEEFTDEQEPGRFLLGGTITHAKLNAYSSFLGDITKDERTIRWEIFDRERGKVIYRRETTGTSEVEGVNNLAATYEAIRNSFKALLAEPTFIATLTPTEILETPVLPASYEIKAIASSNQPLTVEQIVGRSIPSIVQIRTPNARGSGFLIDSSGLIVTNQHVVGSAFSVKVDLYDGSTRIGRILKRDAVSDVALLKLEGSFTDMVGLPICPTSAAKVGESVIAIGNPLALSNTVTQGVVSGFRRDSSRNLIQTDAAINPGNSGGPLLNRQGVVLGIVTEKMVSRGVEGLGFALPIEEALHRMNVKITTSMNSSLNSCGSSAMMVLTENLEANSSNLSQD